MQNGHPVCHLVAYHSTDFSPSQCVQSQVSGQVTSVDSFSFDRSSYTSIMVRGPGDDLLLTGCVSMHLTIS